MSGENSVSVEYNAQDFEVICMQHSRFENLYYGHHITTLCSTLIQSDDPLEWLQYLANASQGNSGSEKAVVFILVPLIRSNNIHHINALFADLTVIVNSISQLPWPVNVILVLHSLCTKHLLRPYIAENTFLQQIATFLTKFPRVVHVRLAQALCSFCLREDIPWETKTQLFLNIQNVIERIKLRDDFYIQAKTEGRILCASPFPGEHVLYVHLPIDMPVTFISWSQAHGSVRNQLLVHIGSENMIPIRLSSTSDDSLWLEHVYQLYEKAGVLPSPVTVTATMAASAVLPSSHRHAALKNSSAVALAYADLIKQVMRHLHCYIMPQPVDKGVSCKESTKNTQNCNYEQLKIPPFHIMRENRHFVSFMRMVALQLQRDNINVTSSTQATASFTDPYLNYNSQYIDEGDTVPLLNEDCSADTAIVVDDVQWSLEEDGFPQPFFPFDTPSSPLPSYDDGHADDQDGVTTPPPLPPARPGKPPTPATRGISVSGVSPRTSPWTPEAGTSSPSTTPPRQRRCRKHKLYNRLWDDYV